MMRGHALAASSLAMALVFVNAGLVNVALPDIGRDLGADVTMMQWIVNAYALTLGSFMLSAGALVDRRGARRMLLLGVAIFGTGSTASALAFSAPMLIAMQAVVGIGSALLVPSSLSLLAHTFPDPGERARALGVWASVNAASFAASPVFAGLLIEVTGWRGVFAVVVPSALCLAILGLWWIEETPVARSSGLDLPGQLLAALALASLTVGLVEGGSEGWGSPPALLALLVAPFAAALFLSVERRARAPMLPLRLFRSRAYSAAVGAGTLLSFAMFGQLFILSLYLQEERGFSATQMGLAFAPQPVVAALAGMFAGRLSTRFGSGAVIVVGGLLGTTGFLLLTMLGSDTGYGILLVALMLIGLAFGTIMPAMVTAAVAAVHRSEVGIASSALNASRQAGGALGVAVLGAFVAGTDFLGGITPSMGLGAVAMLAVATLGLVMHVALARAVEAPAYETPTL